MLHLTGHVNEALSSSCAIPRHEQGMQGCKGNQRRQHTSDMLVCWHEVFGGNATAGRSVAVFGADNETNSVQ
jgi:hypothetical protein